MGWLLLLALTVAAPEPGIVVDRAAPGSAAERAGLRPGDRPRSWTQGALSGPFDTPFALDVVEAERAPCGPVTLVLERDGREETRVLSFDDWGLEVRPDLAPPAAAGLDEARGHADRGEHAQAAARYREGAAAATGSSRRWLLLRAAEAHVLAGDVAGGVAAAAQAFNEAPPQPPLEAAQGARRWADALLRSGRTKEAQAAIDPALRAIETLHPDSLTTAMLLEQRASIALRRASELADADARLERATSLRRRLAPRSLALASGLTLWGRLRGEQGDFPAAYERLREATSLAESVGLASPVHARCLRQQGFVVSATGGFEDGAVLVERARELLETSGRDEPEQANVLATLGVVQLLRGDTSEAERLVRRSIALRERFAPDAAGIARSYTNLGSVSLARGDLGAAESFNLRALALLEGSDGGPEMVFPTLTSLGNIARRHHDLEGAEGYFRRALALLEATNKDGPDVAFALRCLGAVRRDRGDLVGAEGLLRRALALKESKAPLQIGMVDYLQDLAEVLVKRGQAPAAVELLERALGIGEAGAPGSAIVGTNLHLLGEALSAAGRGDAAEERLRSALEIRTELSPGSIHEAQTSHALGRLLARQGRRDEGLALLQRAVTALEAQSRRLGGNRETAVSFRAHYQEYYRELERLLIELGRVDQAFAAAEASRSRALIALMGSRDLELAPERTDELVRARRAADAEYDRFQRRLAGARTAADRVPLKAALAEARRRQDEVRARLRSADPRRHDLHDPQPLDLARARQALEPGTLVLFYSLGPEAGRLYALGPAGEFSVHTLPGTTALRPQVERFVRMVRERRATLGRREIDEAARRIGSTLLGPVEDRIARAERVLVVPDGPLHALPFAALRLPGAGTFLVERVPIHLAASLTLHDQLRQAPRPSAGAGLVVGFGDPRYGDGRSPARSSPGGRPRTPLPWSRGEVAALRELDPGALLHLGPEASERTARALDQRARIVHFACHGFVDDDFPLESGLALSKPASATDDNGLLQAWEIIEDLRLDADLVTLSACESGLGKEFAGEGLLGLTWAFQYAGARSVLASLWEVNDASSAALMGRFYRYLKRGLPKDEALRRAELDLMRRPGTAAPYFWAAFHLVGDWR